MITKQELLELAKDFGLASDVVEKDYALGWILAAIGQHPDTRDTWLFKGGTCLKKCFFETYRFSEDLDFTLLEPGHLDAAFLGKLFGDIAAWVYDETGMVLPPEARKAEVFTNPRGGTSAEGRIGYRGPLGRTGDAPRIKLDLTDHERIVLAPDRREVHHPYSDRPEGGIKVTTYCFEEVFAEKTRALAERLRPRDLYDVVHLYRRQDWAAERPKLISTLAEKCTFKGIPVPTMTSIEASPLRGELEISWRQMLAHQLPVLPTFESFWNELPDVFAWLFEDGQRTQLLTVPIATREPMDAIWRAPPMATSWRTFGVSAPLEIIRFAAANRLCVALDYQDEKGNRTTRTIEPYSLRKSSEGKLLLMAVKTDTGEIRSYRADRIVTAAATQQSFVPRYLVELTDGGPLIGPTLARGHSDVESSSHAVSMVPTRRSPKKFSSSSSTYIVRCAVCGKAFKRHTYDATLNAHKNMNGQVCYGKYGTLESTA